jgi:nucleotide-binding universal stress UspA family protein
MPEIRRILCPIDFSEFSVSAYRHALSVAQHYRAKLFVQQIVELSRYPSASFAVSAGLYREFCRCLLQNAEEELQEFLKNHADNDIQPECVVELGIAPDAILAFAEARKTDLIVMGTHGRRGFDRFMLGSVTERVMRKASCPVLAVRKPPQDPIGPGQQQDPVHLSRILLCTDFSVNSQRALDYAISLATEYKAELTLLHVLEDIPVSASIEGAIATATEQLNRLLPPEERKTASIKTLVRIGKPYQQIVQFALEAQTDVVVMGVRGRGALDLAVFGSTAHRVLQLGPCPAVVIRV